MNVMTPVASVLSWPRDKCESCRHLALDDIAPGSTGYRSSLAGQPFSFWLAFSHVSSSVIFAGSVALISICASSESG